MPCCDYFDRNPSPSFNLSDAENAGGKDGNRCTLLLTEGDSAKSLATTGLSVAGRLNFEVLPQVSIELGSFFATHNELGYVL